MITAEKAFERVQELAKIISKAIESKQEPIKDFDELNTLIDKYHQHITD